MTPDRERRIEELYAQALAYGSRERSAFLDKACGADDALRHAVEALIAQRSFDRSLMQAAGSRISGDRAKRNPTWSGRRLGPYELGELLGAGGMGHVYRATDTRLGRTVAIKILAEHFLDDSQARARFEREARTIAALNHPHICVLHDIGQQDGVDFLVMEYLKGVTLAQKLVKGSLSPAEVTRIALEISDALDKAHRLGVVHRDLKPANVMLTEHGAKLLDFGVAKILLEAKASPQEALTAETNGLTGAGVVIGTPQYMAPEQIEGKQADSRVDVFAFGCVWFEMLTGKKAFVGETAASLMAAILRGNPPEIPAHLSPALRHALNQCWAKNPDERWQSMGDLRREILWVSEAAPQTKAEPRRVSRREILAWGAAGIASVTAGAALWTRQGKPSTIAPTRAHFSIPEPAGLEMNFFQTAPSISPDGRFVAFFAGTGGSGGIHVRRLDSPEIRLLPGTGAALNVFWSPDSRYIGFFSINSLNRIAVDGSPAQVICDTSGPGTGGCWNESGVIVFQDGRDGLLHQVPASGGVKRPLTPPSSTAGLVLQQVPTFLPDGKTILFTQVSSQPDKSGVYAITLGSSEARRIIPNPGMVRFIAPDRLLFSRDGVLTAQPFNPATLQMSGEASVLASDIWSFEDIAGFEASEAGVVVYPRVVAPTSQLNWFDRRGARLKSIGSAGPFIQIDLSRDEKRVVLERYENGRGDLWILDVARDTPTRLTFGPAWSFQAHWSPDNTQLVYAEGQALALRLMRRNAAGGPEQELLSLPLGPSQPTHWSDDGRNVIFTRSGGSGKNELWVLPMDGEGKAAPYLPTPSSAAQGSLSPDGKWMAYASSESGAMDIYVAPFPNPTSKWRISTAGGMQPRWRADGKELFYLTPDKTLMAVSIPSPDRAAVPAPLFQTRATGYFYASRQDYSPSQDGQRFLVNSMLAPGSQSIEVLLGWNRR